MRWINQHFALTCWASLLAVLVLLFVDGCLRFPLRQQSAGIRVTHCQRHVDNLTPGIRCTLQRQVRRGSRVSFYLRIDADKRRRLPASKFYLRGPKQYVNMFGDVTVNGSSHTSMLHPGTNHVVLSADDYQAGPAALVHVIRSKQHYIIVRER
ncbi:hypothetical protein [Lacticaseibacillus hulanensis]|jgi:hypothetical protein|uniref:hypothetical protein n=1 Tax=Lacticaseibacillus hulanensis TaxID=2493111 RepID=UPI000FDC74AD|nr:hypothetical protein [Lacticaseibacillus hulanensis]